jgi:hypothetical protein
MPSAKTASIEQVEHVLLPIEERSSGLLRQYFPKTTDFRNISTKVLAQVARRFNNRSLRRFDDLTLHSKLSSSQASPVRCEFAFILARFRLAVGCHRQLSITSLGLTS